MNNLIVSTIILFIYAAIISYFDIKYKKIFNKCTFPFAVISILLNCIMFGFYGFLISIEGIVLGFFLLFIPFILGGIGGGDVKYLASVGALIGPSNIFYSTLIGLILSGIGAILYLIISKNLKKLINELRLLLYSNTKSINTLSNYGKLPLGAFLSVGIILVWLHSNFL
jgi:prepilin peptidase CpaA